MNYTKTKIVLKYNNPKYATYHKGDECFVAIDRNSGGYPYMVTVWEAHGFKTKEEAAKYAGSDDMSVVEIVFAAEEKEPSK